MCVCVQDRSHLLSSTRKIDLHSSLCSRDLNDWHKDLWLLIEVDQEKARLSRKLDHSLFSAARKVSILHGHCEKVCGVMHDAWVSSGSTARGTTCVNIACSQIPSFALHGFNIAIEWRGPTLLAPLCIASYKDWGKQKNVGKRTAQSCCLKEKKRSYVKSLRLKSEPLTLLKNTEKFKERLLIFSPNNLRRYH